MLTQSGRPIIALRIAEDMAFVHSSNTTRLHPDTTLLALGSRKRYILYQGTHCTPSPSSWMEGCNDVCIGHPGILQYSTYSIVDMLHHQRVLFRAKRALKETSRCQFSQAAKISNMTHIVISSTVLHTTAQALEHLTFSPPAGFIPALTFSTLTRLKNLA